MNKNVKDFTELKNYLIIPESSSKADQRDMTEVLVLVLRPEGVLSVKLDRV